MDIIFSNTNLFIKERQKGAQGDMKREKGRPLSTEGRLEKELRCYELLDSIPVEYERVDHNAAETMEACRAVEETLGAPICKNLFLCNRQQTAFYLCLIPGDKVFKTKELSGQIGSSRLSFAGGEHMQRLLDIAPGSVSILGLMNDREGQVRLLVDKDLLEEEYLGCHPCINTSSLRLRTQDVFGPVLQAMGHTMTVVELFGEEAQAIR